MMSFIKHFPLDMVYEPLYIRLIYPSLELIAVQKYALYISNSNSFLIWYSAGGIGYLKLYPFIFNPEASLVQFVSVLDS